MRYHVVLKDDGNEERKWTFDSWQEAEIEAQFISRQHEDWTPDRYPGRSSRAGEVAVFLDRRVLDRMAPWRELAIVRALVQRPVKKRIAEPRHPRCRSVRPYPVGQARRRRAGLTTLHLVRPARRTAAHAGA